MGSFLSHWVLRPRYPLSHLARLSRAFLIIHLPQQPAVTNPRCRPHPTLSVPQCSLPPPVIELACGTPCPLSGPLSIPQESYQAEVSSLTVPSGNPPNPENTKVLTLGPSIALPSQAPRLQAPFLSSCHVGANWTRVHHPLCEPEPVLPVYPPCP